LWEPKSVGRERARRQKMAQQKAPEMLVA